mgnify:CR=1 FL=1
MSEGMDTEILPKNKPGLQYRWDASRELPVERLERIARFIATLGKRCNSRILQEKFNLQKTTADRYLADQRVLDRVFWLQRYRVKGAVGRALSVLEKLLESKDERIALKAAVEILDRSGLTVAAQEEREQPSQAFQINLNLGGGLKSDHPRSLHPKREEFLVEPKSKPKRGSATTEPRTQSKGFTILMDQEDEKPDSS